MRGGMLQSQVCTKAAAEIDFKKNYNQLLQGETIVGPRRLRQHKTGIC